MRRVALAHWTRSGRWWELSSGIVLCESVLTISSNVCDAAGTAFRTIRV